MNTIDIEALLENTATIETRIEVLSSDGSVDFRLTQEDSVRSWEYTDARYVPDKGVIGMFVERNLDGVLQNIAEDFSIDGREIRLYLGIRRYVADKNEQFSTNGTEFEIIRDTDSKLGDYITVVYCLGNFIITKPEDDEVKDNTKFNARDYTIRFNTLFNADFKDSEYNKSFSELLASQGYVTALWLAKYTCKQVGVELGSETFTNQNFKITSNQFQNGDQCRDVLKYIGKLAYSWVRIDWNNRVQLDFRVKHNVDKTYNNISKDNYYSLTVQNEKVGPINKVVLGSSIIEGDYSFIEDEFAIDTDGEKILVINDNPILYTEELREEAVQTGDVLFELEYTPLVAETTGHPWLQGNELISIENLNGDLIYTYPFDRTITYNGHIKTTISSQTETAIEQDYSYKGTGSAENIQKQTRIILDRAEQTITALAQDISDTADELAQLKITTNSIESTVSKTTEIVVDLENSVNYFSVDLAQSGLTIPTDNNNKPIVTKTYEVPYYGYFKGKQIIPNVIIKNSNVGITASYSTTALKFSVKTDDKITNLSNTYELVFSYEDGDFTYTTNKNITVALAPKGTDGTSVNILGSYESYADLKKAHPIGNIGDAYIVQGDMYVWNVEQNDWVDVGDIQGPAGKDGQDGTNGKSAYQIWLDNGNIGTEQDYLDSLKGEDGYTPIKNVDYFDGQDGDDGKSAYQLWLDSGNTGSIEDYQASLKGEKGDKGDDATTYYTWLKYADTPTSGMSDNPTNKKYMGIAYNKTTPTESNNYNDYAWSLIKGADGEDGVTPIKGVDYFDGYTPVKGKDYFDGDDGKSAYEIWLEEGNTGSEEDYLNSLKGDDGYTPIKGKDYFDGQPGDDGVSIVSVTNYYAKNTSATTAPTSGWSTTRPTRNKNEFLWVKELIKFSNNSEQETTPFVVTGDTGDKGEDGTSYYTHIRYSNNSNGSNMTTDSTGKIYIGIYSGTSKDAPTSYTQYTWSKFRGDDGDDGTDGNGINSITYYYAVTKNQTTPSASSITSPTIPTLTPENKYLWQKEVIDFTDSTVADKTTILLLAVYGDSGQDGYTPVKGKDYFDGYTPIKGVDYFDGDNGTSAYFYVRYSANSNGSGMTTTPQTNTKYMGVASTTSSTAPSSSSAYTWTLIKGTDGSPGSPGSDGKTSYVHIKYSEDGVTFTPAEEDGYGLGEKPSAYIGQYVDYTEADSTNFDDYHWYKFTEDIDPLLNEMKSDIDENSTIIENNYQTLLEKFNGYVPTSEHVSLTTKVQQIQEDTYLKTQIDTMLVDGSVKMVRTTSATFDENGMHYEKTDENGNPTAPTSSTINEVGVSVESTSSKDELLFAGYVDDNKSNKNENLTPYRGQSVVYTQNQIVKNYLVLGSHSRFENFGDDATGCFYIG